MNRVLIGLPRGGGLVKMLVVTDNTSISELAEFLDAVTVYTSPRTTK